MYNWNGKYFETYKEYTERICDEVIENAYKLNGKEELLGINYFDSIEARLGKVEWLEEELFYV